MNEHEDFQPGTIAAQPAITEVNRRSFILKAEAGLKARLEKPERLLSLRQEPDKQRD